MKLQEFEFIPLSQKNKDLAVEFLSPVEESCVTLMSRIYEDFPTEIFSYFILYQNLKNEKKSLFFSVLYFADEKWFSRTLSCYQCL